MQFKKKKKKEKNMSQWMWIRKTLTQFTYVYLPYVSHVKKTFIMSVFLQGTDCPVNALVEFPLTFQIWGQVSFQAAAWGAHASTTHRRL